MDLEILLPIHAVRQAKKKPRDVVAGYDGQQNNSWLLWRGCRSASVYSVVKWILMCASCCQCIHCGEVDCAVCQLLMVTQWLPEV
jgi:hypothetical protein